MSRADQHPVTFRIIIEQPVIGVLHSLQAKDDSPFDPKASPDGAPLVFDVPVWVGPGPKFFGDFVRREGPTRRFVYIRVGQSAGDHGSPWLRRMKIDIHDVEAALLAEAIERGCAIETIVVGTAKDQTPACASVRPKLRRLAVA